jgi:hypothetical protein
MTASDHVKTNSDYRSCDNLTLEPNASIYRKKYIITAPKKEPYINIYGRSLIRDFPE